MIKKYYIVDAKQMGPMGGILPYKVINTLPVIYGPPIIKLTPLLNNNLPIKIKIISDKGDFYIIAPLVFMRPIIDDIYNYAKPSEVPEQNRLSFRIITPSIDSIVKTSYENMLQAVKTIGNKYNNIQYIIPDGKQVDLVQFYDKLII